MQSATKIPVPTERVVCGGDRRVTVGAADIGQRGLDGGQVRVDFDILERRQNGRFMTLNTATEKKQV